MLARKYDNFATQERWEVPEETKKRVKKNNEVSNRRQKRNRILLVIGMLLTMYCVAVVRSETFVSSGNALIALKQQENTLINKNAETKIEVDLLKRTERITSIAAKQLGMSIARNNIYVKTTPVGKDGNAEYA